MGRTSRSLRARELGGVAATPPADRGPDLDPRSTCTAHGPAGRITLLLLASLLVGCASAPEPLELGPPPVGPQRPALAVAPLEVAVEATADRPTVKAGDELRPGERVECVTCGQLLEQSEAQYTVVVDLDQGPRRARAPCPECGGKTFRDPFSPPFRPRLSGPAIDAELVGTLRARGAFAAVGVPPETAGWRLESRLESSAVRYARNGVFGLEIATFIVTAVLIFPCVDFPNWFFASEDYTLELTGSWTLRDGASVVAEGVVQTKTTGSFAEFGPGPTREWHLVGFLRAPGCLEEDEWSEIADQLVPTAQLDFARELARQVEAVKP